MCLTINIQRVETLILDTAGSRAPSLPTPAMQRVQQFLGRYGREPISDVTARPADKRSRFCPQCGGRGGYEAQIGDIAGNFGWLDCPACHGTGRGR